jgi:hypothetical protein
MSIFASDTTETFEVPFDPPHTVTIRKLTGKKLMKAQKAFFNELIAEVQSRGGARVQKDIEQLFEKGTKTAEEIAKVKADPLNGYDKHALIAAGLASWTYPKSLEPVAVTEKTADGREVTVMVVPAIEDLDDEAVEFFATEVLRLTKPSLFLTADAAKADRKNG